MVVICLSEITIAKFNVKQKAKCDLFNVKHKKLVLAYATF